MRRSAMPRPGAPGGKGPTLVEAVTYRLGLHTTADDPTRYEPREMHERGSTAIRCAACSCI